MESFVINDQWGKKNRLVYERYNINFMYLITTVGLLVSVAEPLILPFNVSVCTVLRKYDISYMPNNSFSD